MLAAYVVCIILAVGLSSAQPVTVGRILDYNTRVEDSNVLHYLQAFNNDLTDVTIVDTLPPGFRVDDAVETDDGVMVTSYAGVMKAGSTAELLYTFTPPESGEYNISTQLTYILGGEEHTTIESNTAFTVDRLSSNSETSLSKSSEVLMIFVALAIISFISLNTGKKKS